MNRNTPTAFQDRVNALAAIMQKPWPAEDGPAVLKSMDTTLPADAGIKKVFNLACARLIWLQFATDKPETARLKVIRESLATILAFIQASGHPLEDVLDLIVGQVEEAGDAAQVTAEDTATLDLLNDEIQRVSRLPLTGATKQALIQANMDAFDMEMEAVLIAVAARLAEATSPKDRAEAALQARYPGLKPASL